MTTTRRRQAPTTRPLSSTKITQPLAESAELAPTPISAAERSVQRAVALGHTTCSWSARLAGWVLRLDGALDNAAWWIQSASREEVRYHVVYSAAQDDALCHCESAQHGRACWHRGLAIMKGRSMAYGYSAAGRAEAARDYWREVAAEDNARVLGFSH